MIINNQKCCICGEEFRGYGNDPWPLRDEGRCCDMCAKLIVLPSRILQLHGFLDNPQESSGQRGKHVDLHRK